MRARYIKFEMRVTVYYALLKFIFNIRYHAHRLRESIINVDHLSYIIPLRLIHSICIRTFFESQINVMYLLGKLL